MTTSQHFQADASKNPKNLFGSPADDLAASGLSVPEDPFMEPSDTFDFGDENTAASRKRQSSARSARANAPASRPSVSGRVVERSHRAQSADASPQGKAAASQGASTEPCASDAKASAARRRGIGWRTWALIVGIVVLVALAIGGVYAWNALFRFDDAADIQGEWRTADNAMIVVIDAENMYLPEGLTYAYTLDISAKSISFAFSNLTGAGIYEFSDDRRTLTITEGEEGSSRVTVLCKVSDNAEASARMLSEEEAALFAEGPSGGEGDSEQDSAAAAEPLPGLPQGEGGQTAGSNAALPPTSEDAASQEAAESDAQDYEEDSAWDETTAEA